MKVDKFDLFAEAQADIADQGKQTRRDKTSPTSKEWGQLCDDFVQNIREGQRFYLPGDATLLNGRNVTEEMKVWMRLPYDRMALLSESNFPHLGRRAEKITCAVQKEDPELGLLWFVTSAIRVATSNPEEKLDRAWAAMPICVIYVYPEKGDGYHRELHRPFKDALVEKGYNADLQMQDMDDDVAALQSLCAMLSLENCKAERINPKKIKGAGISNAKRALYSYHVLNVGGELWTAPEPGNLGTGPGVRSHLRRGHIRRLDDGRRTWVRPAFVHGRVDGFVEKDYNLKGPT